MTIRTWCSAELHYGYDNDCNASDPGETYTKTFEICSGGGSDSDYGSTTLISGPDYWPSSGGGGGSGDLDGSDGDPNDPGAIGDDPFAEPVLTEELVSYKPTFQYPNGSDYAEKYPKLTEYLRNKLPNVKDMPVITNAIQDITNLSLTQIQHDLEWGNGPTIVIMQLDNYADNTSYKTVGAFDDENPEILLLDIDWVNRLENDITDQGLEDAYLFFLGVSILHEYVHYGDFLNGNRYRYPKTAEEGVLFELGVYGTDVEPTTLIFEKN